MRRYLLVFMILFAVPASVFSFTELEKLLIAEASTPELRKIAKDYFGKKAVEQRELAEKYKALSIQSRGGKSVNEDLEKKKYKHLFEQTSKEADRYQEQAEKF